MGLPLYSRRALEEPVIKPVQKSRHPGIIAFHQSSARSSGYGQLLLESGRVVRVLPEKVRKFPAEFRHHLPGTKRNHILVYRVAKALLGFGFDTVEQMSQRVVLLSEQPIVGRACVP